MIYHHGERGVFQVYLLNPNYTPKIEVDNYSERRTATYPTTGEELQVWTINSMLEIPTDDTTYWCTIHKGPELVKKHHIVGVIQDLLYFLNAVRVIISLIKHFKNLFSLTFDSEMTKAKDTFTTCLSTNATQPMGEMTLKCSQISSNTKVNSASAPETPPVQCQQSTVPSY